jgi:hypothetical protein
MSEKTLKLDEVVGRVAQLTQSLLEDGAVPSEVAFALASVATDMGLQVAGDPLKVFPLLLAAIAGAANTRLHTETETLDITAQATPDGTTIH